MRRVVLRPGRGRKKPASVLPYTRSSKAAQAKADMRYVKSCERLDVTGRKTAFSIAFTINHAIKAFVRFIT